VETETRDAEGHEGLYHANQVAAYEFSERRAALAARVSSCLDRAFDAIGANSSVQEVIYWNLNVTKTIGRNDIMDRPTEFIEGLQAIYGKAGTAVFEHMLIREIRREFGLGASFDNEITRASSSSDLLHLIVHLALESDELR
jgi:hypothetical protein